MRMSIGVVLQTRLPDMNKLVSKEAISVVDRACGDTVTMAQVLVPKDTTAAQNSTYARTPLRNDYQKASEAALELRPGVEIYHDMEPREGAAFPYGKVEYGMVAVLVFYGAYLELGTVDMPARPYLGPAASNASAVFLSRMAGVLNTAFSRAAVLKIER